MTDDLVERHASADRNHERIWLSAVCDDERTWCQDSRGGCDECGNPEVEYIRADIVTDLRTRLEAAEAEVARMREACRQVAERYVVASAADSNPDEYNQGWKAAAKAIEHEIRLGDPLRNAAALHPGEREP